MSAPIPSQIAYDLILPFDAQLRFGVRAEGTAQIIIGETVIWQTDSNIDETAQIDLSRYGGQSTTLRFVATGDGGEVEWRYPQLVTSSSWLTPRRDLLARYQFSQGIELIDWKITADGVYLQWAVQEVTTTSPTVFVHAFSAQDELIAQHDGIPVQGSYPISLWQMGYLITDFHPLTTTSVHHFAVGLYDPTTLQRYHLIGADGQTTDQVIFTP